MEPSERNETSSKQGLDNLGSLSPEERKRRLEEHMSALAGDSAKIKEYFIANQLLLRDVLPEDMTLIEQHQDGFVYYWLEEKTRQQKELSKRHQLDGSNGIEQEAMFYAQNAHSGQKYAKVLPYCHHLAAVVGVLRRFDVYDPVMLAAAWLHDIIEDQGVLKEQLAEYFSSEIADLVWRVSNEEGFNRRERNKKTYPKICASPQARILKLADRIANVEACIHAAGVENLFLMYEKEYDGFTQALRARGPRGTETEQDTELKMWVYLDDLMFTGRKIINEENEKHG